MSLHFCPHCHRPHPLDAEFCPATGRRIVRLRSAGRLPFSALGLIGLSMMGAGVWLLLPDWQPSLARSGPSPSRNPSATPTRSMARASRGDQATLAPTATPTLTPSPTPTSTRAPTPTDEPSPTSPPHLPPRGRIVYTCFDDHDDEICLINADGSGQVQLTHNDAGDFYASLAPDGRFIVFARQMEGRTTRSSA